MSINTGCDRRLRGRAPETPGDAAGEKTGTTGPRRERQPRKRRQLALRASLTDSMQGPQRCQPGLAELRGHAHGRTRGLRRGSPQQAVGLPTQSGSQGVQAVRRTTILDTLASSAPVSLGINHLVADEANSSAPG
jgi:hypothetical protein